MYKRITIYVLGLFILSLGVAFSILSKLGVSPISSVAYVLHNVTGLSIGTITMMEFSVYVLAQIVLLRKKFKMRSFLQLGFGIAFGLFVDLSLFITTIFRIDNVLVQSGYLVLSIILIALGLVFILTADIVPNAPEGLMLAIKDIFKFKFSNIKTIFDSSCVIFSSLIAIFLLVEFSQSGIGIGTLLTALLVGKVLGFFMSRMKKPLVLFMKSR